MAIFVASSLFAVYLAEALIEISPGIKSTSSTSGISIVFVYIAVAIAFTFVILFVARRRRISILRYVFYVLIAYVTFFVSSILAAIVSVNIVEYYVITFAIPVVILVFLLVSNEWYVIDLAGFFLSAGVSAVWGVEIGIWAAVVFLVAFAIYDYIAVYKTKHMVSLARVAVDESIPLLFVSPSRRNFTMRDLTFDNRGEQEVLMLGFGDVALPSILVVSSAVYGISHPLPFIGLPLAGALAGMAFLFFFNKNRPAPGLPYINTGAILGFLIAFFMYFPLRP
ncbi:hypothetical protein GCM10007108_02380 [Thermogymnomonas acidicola]|uniref:Signal-peptide peptidase, presenilin aspartyl protease n=2 Tax=Thermogymnomonas acidicola TaxID=399579 RepID=A0AA37F8Y5_9ARCH|nr:hypothetical protein GCM10007108_02380 [Thermogymnomonas acidicola]